MARKTISNRVRFEVLKRDGFACHYCGRKSPQVDLEIDHIQAVANGGSNDIGNLIAACQQCNSGKTDSRLWNQSSIDCCGDSDIEMYCASLSVYEDLWLELTARFGFAITSKAAIDSTTKLFAEWSGMVIEEKDGTGKHVHDLIVNEVFRLMEKMVQASYLTKEMSSSFESSAEEHY